MKFTKLTLVALLLALLVCAFVACGGPTETDNGSETDKGTETDVTPGTDDETKHVHTLVEQIDEPTCQAKGYKKQVCSVCEEVVDVSPILAIDHVAVAPATCTEDSVCQFCGVMLAPATGHTLGTITDSKPATATEAGYEKGACTVCGAELTNVIAAHVVETFDGLEVGELTSEALNATGNLSGFTAELGSSSTYSVVADGDNKYIFKLGDKNNATLTLKDDNGVLITGKFAVSFDYRFDSLGDIAGPTGSINSGVVSIKDGSNKETRILSMWQTGKEAEGNATYGIRFHKDKSSYVVPNMKPGSETWINIRVVLDPSTFDYEVYVDGVKVFYTVYDETLAKHVEWTLADGAWTSVEAPKADPYADPANGISSIYLFHYSVYECSVDNLKVEFIG